MRSFLVLFALISMVLADHIDWSKVTINEPRIPLPSNLEQHLAKPRIVGGEEAVPNSLPYQVGLLVTFDEGTYFCGGSLISPRHVLTAAHCTESLLSRPLEIEVRLGAHRIQETGGQVIMRTTSYITHPDWLPSLLRSDIAIVNLPSTVTLTDNIQPVRLPSRSDIGNDIVGTTARISGWGLTSDSSTTISPTLREASVDVMSIAACRFAMRWWEIAIIAESHLCTSGDGGRGICSGDSGGPVVSNDRLIGVAAFGLVNGCELGLPSIHTRVSTFLDWIEANSDVSID
nr:brachyurin-like [Onthophagus taurus]